MATRIVVPDAGQTTDTLLVETIYVAVGDTVEVGAIVADIETDKALMELEAYAAGEVLAILAQPGDSVEVGQTLLVLGAPGEVWTAEAPPEPAPAVELAAADPPESTPGFLATPAARTTARQRGIDPRELVGTGPGGCVVKRDVPSGERRLPLSPMRRTIGTRLQQSVREAPHFYVAAEADLTAALALRERCAEASINDLLLTAAAAALVAVPRVNCRLDGDSLLLLDQVNLGVAVAVDDGLVVPVLVDADRLGLRELAGRTRSLIGEARAGRLGSARASLTVSNLGMYGVTSFSAIINPPEPCILGVGAVRDQLALTDRGIVARPTVSLTLSADHRVLDGRIAAEFLQAMRVSLENAATWRID